MASDRELKRRIKSVQDIGQITKAMKMVASAQLRKVESRSMEAKPYTEKLKAVVGKLSSQAGEAATPEMIPHPLEKGEKPRIAVLIVASDNGLCGSYNANLFKFVEKHLEEQQAPPTKSIMLGNKAIRYFSKRGIVPDHKVSKWKPEFTLAKNLVDVCTKWFLNNEVDEVHCFYTEALTKMSCEPRHLRLLPLACQDYLNAEPGPAAQDFTKQVDYIFEPNAKEALAKIIPSYLRIIMQQVLLESKSSELGSRLKAMTNASDNADALAAELTLAYYRIRQNNITTEIIEISSGAEALA